MKKFWVSNYNSLIFISIYFGLTVIAFSKDKSKVLPGFLNEKSSRLWITTQA